VPPLTAGASYSWKKVNMRYRLSGSISGLAACTAVLLIAGCAGERLVNIRDASEFRRVAIESDRPVAVEMFKGG
jgi:hypothetical protein